MAAAAATVVGCPAVVEPTTSTTLAPGAIASAYCTSKLVSTLQPASAWCLSLGAKTGHPSGHRIVKDGGAGTWNSASNVARSCATVGLPKASTMRIVCPAPFRAAGKLYALRTKLGV